jgi:hypothetical protein
MHLKKRGVEAILVRVFEFRGECTSCVSVKTSYFEKIGASNWTPKTIPSAARKSSALLYPFALAQTGSSGRCQEASN